MPENCLMFLRLPCMANCVFGKKFCGFITNSALLEQNTRGSVRSPDSRGQNLDFRVWGIILLNKFLDFHRELEPLLRLPCMENYSSREPQDFRV